ncbi:MAG: hypothetical protein P4L60_15180 [Clostridium sp.]|nr:hypothetical protein [Clostridium sp.]
MAQRDQLKYIGHDCTQLIFNYTPMIDRLHIISTCKYLYNKEHVVTFYYSEDGGYYYNNLNHHYYDIKGQKIRIK